MSKQTKPSIVFCHGIWADGSCFNKVIPALQAALTAVSPAGLHFKPQMAPSTTAEIRLSAWTCSWSVNGQRWSSQSSP
jgi:hypothetical protein